MCFYKVTKTLFIICSVYTLSLAWGYAADHSKNYNIASQKLSSGLIEFAKQAEISLLYSDKDVKGLVSQPLNRTYSITGALRRLLTGTALKAVALTDKTYLISRLETSKTVNAFEDIYNSPDKSSGNQPPNYIGDILVTGSRIARSDLTSSRPVVTISGAQITMSGTTNVEDYLAEIPQILAGRSGTTISNGSDGTTTVNLRGLGEQRSLILLNGRRFIPTNPMGTIDLSSISVSLIDQVEIVTGGASAVYGSGAISGVINFIMKDDFEGLELGSQVGITDKGDGERWTTNLTMGANFEDGRGNMTLYVSYNRRTNIKQRDRGWESTFLTVGPGGLTESGSSFTPGGRIDGVAGTTYYFTEDGGARPYNSADAYNFKQSQDLQTAARRVNFNTTFRYDLTDNMVLFAEGMFVNSRNSTGLAPAPGSLRYSDSASDQDPAINLNYLNHPFLAQSAEDVFALLDTGTGADLVPNDGIVQFNNRIRRRTSEVGPRTRNHESNTFRALLGVKGDLSDDIQYEAFYSGGRVKRVQILDNAVDENRWRQGINVIEDMAGNIVCVDPSAGCVPVNMFGEGNISDEAADWIRLKLRNVTTYQLQNAGLVLSGTIEGLNAGQIGYAGGYEWRSEKSELSPDSSLAANDAQGFRTLQPTIGSYSVHELFAEVDIPLISDRPGIDYLAVNAAARYSNYSTNVGGIVTYKYGVDYAPISQIRFRAQYQRAARAPNISELFQGSSGSQPADPDFCIAGAAASVLSFCRALGVPGAGIVATPDQIRQLTGGNPDLEEETADTFTIGAVIQPMDNLSIIFDYYDIKIDNYIGLFGNGANTVVHGCLISRNVNSDFCQRITRLAASGAIEEVNTSFTNNPRLTTRGFDLAVNYGFDVDALALFEKAAMIRLNLNANYIIESTIISDILDPAKIDCAGVLGVDGGTCPNGAIDQRGAGATPEWTANLAVNYYSGPLSLRLTYRYIDSVIDERIIRDLPSVIGTRRPDPDGFDAQHYFDLSASYQMSEDLLVTGGIKNLFDNEPPITGTQVTGFFSNTDTQTYDPIGRRFYLGVTAEF